MSAHYDSQEEAELARDCAEMAEILHEKGKHELADALQAVADVKRNENSPGGAPPPEPEVRSRSADELLEAVERGELTAAEAREQLAAEELDRRPSTNHG